MDTHGTRETFIQDARLVSDFRRSHQPRAVRHAAQRPSGYPSRMHLEVLNATQLGPQVLGGR